MRENPYSGLFRKGTVIPGYTKLAGQSNPFTDNAGNINASGIADLFHQIGEAMSNFGPQAKQQATQTQAGAEVLASRREALMEAVNDQTGKSMQMLGAAVTAEIEETTNREGFARKILQYREVGFGETNQVTIKEKNVIAFLAVSASEVTPVEVRARQLIPPEFHVDGYILIDTKEIATSTGDLLGDKYEEGLEAVMVQEDRLWKRMADRISTARNTIQNFATLTPTVFARLINQVARWGVPVTSCLLSSLLWQDVIANGDFAGVLDPVTKWELLQEGYLGQMYGVSITTDNFRQPNLKVLEDGEIYVNGAPINAGVFTLRGSLTSTPVDRAVVGEAKKGWFLDEIISVVMPNAYAVAYGRKI